MSVPDPFRPLEGGVLHRLDIGIAEAMGGRRGKTITWHATRPIVALGVRSADAAAVLHWAIVGLAALLVVNRVRTRSRRSRLARA